MTSDQTEKPANDNMKASVRWRGEGIAFDGRTGTGSSIALDGPADLGGRGLGARPMELVLLGAAACSAFDVVYFLQRSRQPIADCLVEVEGERAEEHPRVFTAIKLNFRVFGDGLAEERVKRAVQRSVTEICSALKMLEKTARIDFSWQIEPAATATELLSA